MNEKEEYDQLKPKETDKVYNKELEAETDEITDRSLLCGWGKWRPNWLQLFSRPSVFLVFIFIFALTSGNNKFVQDLILKISTLFELSIFMHASSKLDTVAQALNEVQTSWPNFSTFHFV